MKYDLNQMIDFLNDMGDWFNKQASITKEDREYWAYLYNGENCYQIARYLRETNAKD